MGSLVFLSVICIIVPVNVLDKLVGSKNALYFCQNISESIIIQNVSLPRAICTLHLHLADAFIQSDLQKYLGS